MTVTTLEATLKERFGFEAFRPGQKEVIEDILKGHDVFCMLPTGSGKSLCYQLAGELLGGLVVIVSPLVSLMEDQVEALRLHGEKRAAALNSFLGREEKERLLRSLHECRFLYISPEMLQSERVRRALKRANVTLFVVDEAHCVSEWGYEFRPDYLKLGAIREDIGRPPCLAMTATADEKTRADIIARLGIAHCRLHLYGVDRPNIAIAVEKMDTGAEKLERLIELVTNLQGPGIVYFSSRKAAEAVHAVLRSRTKVRTAYYHAGMDAEERLLVQNQFFYDQLDVVCATTAFGMGINKANVRYVIHFHYPLYVNAYLQEIGRAGRDGKPSVAIALVAKEDHLLPERLIHREFPEVDRLPALIRSIRTAGSALDRAAAEAVLTEAGLSETAGRFLVETLSALDEEGRKPLHDVIRRIEKRIAERKAVKFRELSIMREWLETTGCRRQAMLRLFHEEKAGNAGDCCDACGLDLNVYRKSSAQGRETPLLDPWQKRLAKLFGRAVPAR